MKSFKWNNIKFVIKKYGSYYYTYPYDLVRIGKGNIRITQEEGITPEEAKINAINRLNKEGYKRTKECLLLAILK